MPIPTLASSLATDHIELSIKPIIALMPKVLQDTISHQPSADTRIQVPLRLIIPQLSRGSVRINFGDLKQLCASGIFSPSIRWDQELVSLPLQLIIPQLPENLLARRPNQKTVKVPDEIIVVFGGPRHATPAKPKQREEPEAPQHPPSSPAPLTSTGAAAVPVAPKPTAPASPGSSLPPSPALTPLSSLYSSGQPARPGMPTSAGIKPGGSVPGAPATPATSGPAASPGVPTPPDQGAIKMSAAYQSQFLSPTPPSANAGSAPSPSTIPIRPELKPASAPLSVFPSTPGQSAVRPGLPGTTGSVPPAQASASKPSAAATPDPAARAVVAATPVSVVQEPGRMAVAIKDVMVNWPEVICQELGQLNVLNGVVSVPCDQADPAFKQGKMVFNWNQVRGWIRPAIPAGLNTPHGEHKLELPLALFVPLFLAQRKPDRTGRQMAIPENIPDLFARPVVATPAPAPTAPAIPATLMSTSIPAPAPPKTLIATQLPPPSAPAVQPSAEMMAAPLSTMPSDEPTPDISDVFGQPGKRHWTPAEIAQKTATLPGVAGALIAMQDGLLVASQLPPNLNSEMIAAFLPQMFGRMSHYTSELKLGEPSSLLLVVNQAPLQISRVGRVFYTVLGKQGQSLPSPAIAAVIAQLDRQAKQL